MYELCFKKKKKKNLDKIINVLILIIIWSPIAKKIAFNFIYETPYTYNSS